MENANASKAIGAGFIATLVMTLMMYIAPMMGMPKMDIAYVNQRDASTVERSVVDGNDLSFY